MKRVLIVYPYYIPMGAVENFIKDLATELHLRGYTVFILTFRINKTLIALHPPRGISEPIEEKRIERINNVILLRVELPEFLAKIGIPRYSMASLFVLSSYLSNIIYRITNKYNINTIYANEYIAILASYIAYKRMRNKKLRLVASVHSSYNIKNYVKYKIFINVLRHFEKVIVVNPSTETYRRLARSLNNVVFLPIGIDAERFRPRPELKQKFRQELGLPKDNIIFLYIARFVPAKNPLRTLIAFYELLKRTQRSDLTLVMLGYGELEEIIKMLIEKLDLMRNVILLKPIPYNDPRLPIIYNASDVFLSLHLHEGTNAVVLEALASGLSVIHSDVPGVPKILKEVLIMVNPLSIFEIFKSMAEIVNSPNKFNNQGIRARRIAMIFSRKRLLSKIANMIIGADLDDNICIGG